MPKTHKIKRTFASKYPLAVGMLVDASRWANRRALENGGYIIKLRETELSDETEEIQEIAPIIEPVEEVVEPIEEYGQPEINETPVIIENEITAPDQTVKKSKISKPKKPKSSIK